MDYISPNQILFNYSNRFEYLTSFHLPTHFQTSKKTKKKHRKGTIALKSPSFIWKKNRMKLMGYISNNKADIEQILTSF